MSMEINLRHSVERLNDSNLTEKLQQALDHSLENMRRNDLTRNLGPKRESLSNVIPITVVYSLIFITGLFGNLCTCVVIAKNKYMRTITNMYLFNLAVADVLFLLLGLPFEVYSFWSAYPWIFGEAFCYMRSMAAETTTCASVLTITAFTIERYVAFRHPTKSASIASLSRVGKVIVYIWLFSILLAIPPTVKFGIVYKHDSRNQTIKESARCTLKQVDSTGPLFTISAFLIFMLPMTIISVMYVLIALKLHRSTQQRRDSLSSVEGRNLRGCFPGYRQIQERKAVVKMLVAVVVAFFVCWAPFHVQRLMVIYVRRWTKEMRRVEKIIFYISGVLYYFSSAINPILYNLMSVKYRQAFKSTFLKTCHRRTNLYRKEAVFYRRKEKLYRLKDVGDYLNTRVKRSKPPICPDPVPSDTLGFPKKDINGEPSTEAIFSNAYHNIRKMNYSCVSINELKKTNFSNVCRPASTIPIIQSHPTKAHSTRPLE